MAALTSPSMSCLWPFLYHSPSHVNVVAQTKSPSQWVQDWLTFSHGERYGSVTTSHISGAMPLRSTQKSHWKDREGSKFWFQVFCDSAFCFRLKPTTPWISPPTGGATSLSKLISKQVVETSLIHISFCKFKTNQFILNYCSRKTKPLDYFI